MYKKIGNYGIIGNMRSVALVGLDGSIDWLCLPDIDSPSVFAALLDCKKGGRFRICPRDAFDSTAFYIKETNVLVTQFRTSSGVLKVTDFMPLGEGKRKAPLMDLCRVAEVISGSVNVEVVFEPRFNYAQAPTMVERLPKGFLANGDSQSLMLLTDVPLREISGDSPHIIWKASQGERSFFALKLAPSHTLDISEACIVESMEETVKFWRGWLAGAQTGPLTDIKWHREFLERSALVLKLLQYEPTGAIAAAATTSLPESIGSVRNWDYRFSWVRDTSMTLKALFQLGHLEETHAYLRWVEDLLARHGPQRLQIMYGLRGEEELEERELAHLEGYKGSRPVRVGNAAARQRQLDIYGEIMDAALKLSQYVGKVDPSMWRGLRDICNYVSEIWNEKDFGIWETRCDPVHHVHSKVMCWVALDRGITIAKRYGFPAELSLWRRQRDLIKYEVLQKSFNKEKGSFVQHYETDELDASALRIPLVGFLPFDDPRVASTVEAVRRELDYDGLLLRYRARDGLPGGEGAFLLCNFWLIMCLVGLGRTEEAEATLCRTEKAANHLGLFSEQYDPRWREALGNYPQALTHIVYINSVLSLYQPSTQASIRPRPKPGWRRLLRAWPPSKVTLNCGQPAQDVPAQQLAQRLKDTMNLLRGAFFDTSRGRVAYERMSRSALYEKYLSLAASLREFEFQTLGDRCDQMAFWINLYNVIVIHGVIEMGVMDSVKEVPNFFNRVIYQVGPYQFSPNDIEHGILRGNRRPPLSPFRRFSHNDPRRRFSINPMDPRIHFTLVCASSSCPPIELYRADILDHQLTIAAETFLNSGGITIDRDTRHISLSRIFKWYGRDFGDSFQEMISYLAPYLHNEEDRRFLLDLPKEVRISYQPYDWRLNRT